MEKRRIEETLYQKLEQLSKSDVYPFHMPGHKRRLREGLLKEAACIDITEIDGFDNLHHAEGIIRQEQEFAARLYGSRQCFFLVNGSSCGVMAAVCAAAKEGETILMARHSHKSAYHAVYLQKLNAQYLYPQQSQQGFPAGGITPEQVGRQLDSCGAKAVLITSPTYEGVISDIASIAQVVHDRGAILIVDEAHGAHLKFHKAFGESAVDTGADIVVQSLHKTMPSLTQTALLHICSDRAPVERVRRYLELFQTSSPSYVLMASISHCLHMAAENKQLYFAPYVERLERFYRQTAGLQRIRVLGGADFRQAYGVQKDPSKLILYAGNLTDREGRRFGGHQLMEALRKGYHLETEMETRDYVLAMTSFLDTQEGFDRLKQALFEIEEGLTVGAQNDKNSGAGGGQPGDENLNPEQICSIDQAVDGNTEIIDWEDAAGRVSCEYLYLYPPGSPVIVPGERISKHVWEYVQESRQMGLNVQGPEDYAFNKLKVLRITNG